MSTLRHLVRTARSSSWRRRGVVLLIDGQAPVDRIRESPFQAPQRLLGRLALGQLAPVIGLPGAREVERISDK
jgi:hypothetical protein